MTATSWRRLLALGCILVLTLLFFHQLAFSGKILARGDTYQYFYPYWDARNEAFRAGNMPLWTPNLFMGVPLLANPQLGTYYPPNWLTAPFRAPTAIALSIMLHVALAAAGTVFLYRQVVSKQWIPALVAGVAFAFGGAVSSHVEQINQLQGLAWMPILFALYHRLLDGERARRDGLLLAVAWALQVFSGHTQTVFISGVGLGGLWFRLLRHLFRAATSTLAAATIAAAISGQFCNGALIGAASIIAEPGAATGVQSERRVQPAGSDLFFAAAQHVGPCPAAELRWTALRRIRSYPWHHWLGASALGHSVFSRE